VLRVGKKKDTEGMLVFLCRVTVQIQWRRSAQQFERLSLEDCVGHLERTRELCKEGGVGALLCNIKGDAYIFECVTRGQDV
jgi:hypothetical protein